MGLLGNKDVVHDVQIRTRLIAIQAKAVSAGYPKAVVNQVDAAAAQGNPISHVSATNLYGVIGDQISLVAVQFEVGYIMPVELPWLEFLRMLRFLPRLSEWNKRCNPESRFRQCCRNRFDKGKGRFPAVEGIAAKSAVCSIMVNPGIIAIEYAGQDVQIRSLRTIGGYDAVS